jgi:signal transduction histidine kinase
MDALGEAATELPCLSPCAAALAALARAPTATLWPEVRTDPGLVLLVVRTLPSHTPPGPSTFPAALGDPVVLESAARHLRQRSPGYVAWNKPPFVTVYRSALACAQLAETVSACSERADPASAWVAGLLAPLGWLAACAAHPVASWPQVLPGALDHAAIARRLNRHWRLPDWLAAVTGHLALPAEAVQPLGADADLFRVVQLAALLAEQQGRGLGLAVGGTQEHLAAALGLTTAEVEEIRVAAEEPEGVPVWQRPDEVPLLADLLQLAADNRRLRGWPALDGAERDVDALQRALVAQRATEAERLHRLKLAALAEVAAGAGHEINNPLAVISGQAQYLLGHESDPERRRSLQTIVTHANRIHQTVTDLMQFARPPSPRGQTVDVGGLVREAATALRDLAEQRQVRLVCVEPAAPVTAHGDPAQVRTALRALLRNAIEAAPGEGWAGVRVGRADGGEVQLVVEDSGRGPGAAEREHLFDPFYSGRKAGRGRGLGLSTAWRLARENGGDVRYDAAPQGPTRFVLTLPASPDGAANGDEPPTPARNGTNGCRPAPTAP